MGAEEGDNLLEMLRGALMHVYALMTMGVCRPYASNSYLKDA
jgi:hypothetical protein